MSINLLLLKPGEPETDPCLQFIPVKVQTAHEEDTNVDTYFDDYTSQSDETPDGTLHNSLRGYPICGQRFAIPGTHLGMIVSEDKKPLTETADRFFGQTGSFENFVLWNYDQIPSRNDALKMAVEGFCLTEELHKRVDPIELELFLLSEQPSTSKDETKKEADNSRKELKDQDTTVDQMEL